MSKTSGIIGSKHELVYRDILSGILEGRFRSGDRLPTEADLVRHYGVGLTSVRQALSRLSKQGMIEKRQGSGSYVSKLAGANPPNHQQVVWIRSNAMILPSEKNPYWSGPLREGLTYGALLHHLRLVYDPPLLSHRTAGIGIPTIPSAGVIAIHAGGDDAPELLADVGDGVPKVIVNRHSNDPRIPSIDIDQSSGTFQAVSALLRFGHRRIMITTTDPATDVCDHRVDGYRKAYESAGLYVDESMVIAEPVENAEQWAHWPEIFRKAVRRLRPTALVINNLGRMLHVLDILRSEGLEVPRDVSLIAFDDSPELLRTSPTITAIRQPVYQMGKLAIDILVEMGKSEYAVQRHQCLRPELILRESVAVPRSE